jgi:hypothetical protein
VAVAAMMKRRIDAHNVVEDSGHKMTIDKIDDGPILTRESSDVNHEWTEVWLTQGAFCARVGEQIDAWP